MNNLLLQALRILPKETFVWKPFLSRVQDSAGLWVNTYSAPVTCKGSLQTVAQEIYTKLGLDFEKNYKRVYTTVHLKGMENGQVSPDLVIYGGYTWKVTGETHWNDLNGWGSYLIVQDEVENV